MKTLRYSTQYKKDFKRYRNNPSKLAKLLKVFRMLEKEIELPAKYRGHMLKGDYLGCMECHIESDFLLIWLDPETDVIEILNWSHINFLGEYSFQSNMALGLNEYRPLKV